MGEDGCVGGVEKKMKRILQLPAEAPGRMEEGRISTVFTIIHAEIPSHLYS